MKNPLKYSDFAKAIQCNRASITMAVKVGTLIAIEGKKEIDPDNPTNQAWILRQEMKGKKFDINLIYNSNLEKKQEIITEQGKKTEQGKRIISLDDIRKIELRQKVANLKKTEREVKMNDLKIQKMKGELIPFNAASDVFMFAIESYRTTFLQGVKSISNVFAQRLGANHVQFVEIQQKLSETVKLITEEAKITVQNGLENVVKEYQEVRSRGESK